MFYQVVNYYLDNDLWSVSDARTRWR